MRYDLELSKEEYILNILLKQYLPEKAKDKNNSVISYQILF